MSALKNLLSPFLVLFSLQLWSGISRAENIAFSVRALGMGNAYTALVKDGDSVFYNPGGLSQMGGLQWTIIDPAIGINNVLDYQTFLDISNSNDVVGSLSPLFGTSLSLYGAGSKTLFGFGGFVAGAYGVGEAELKINNPAFPNLSTRIRGDYGFLLGWGTEIIPDRLGVGVTARRVTRQGGNLKIGPEVLVTLDPDKIKENFEKVGVGTAVDLGMNLSFPVLLNPTFSLVWRDLGTTSFTATSPLGSPPSSPQEIILGLGLSMDTLLFDFSFGIDYRYAQKKDVIGKKLNIGTEFGFAMIDLRAGLHHGYFSGGLGFDLWLLRMDLASYVEELGAYPGQLPDRRYLMQIGLHLLFGTKKKSSSLNSRDDEREEDDDSQTGDSQRWSPGRDSSNPYTQDQRMRRYKEQQRRKRIQRRF